MFFKPLKTQPALGNRVAAIKCFLNLGTGECLFPLLRHLLFLSTPKQKMRIAALALLPLVLLSFNSILSGYDDIELPDVVIFGEAEKLPDTISLDELLRQYWSLRDHSRFEYRPFISFEPVRQYEKELRPEDQGIVSLSLGSDFDDLFLLNLRASYYQPDNLLHRYLMTVNSESFSGKRSWFNTAFSWQPDIAELLSLDEITASSKTEAFLEFNSFRDQDIINNDIDSYRLGLHLKSGKTEYFNLLDIYLAFNHIAQTVSPADAADTGFVNIDTEETDIDVILKTTIPVGQDTDRQAKIPVTLSSIRDKQAMSVAYTLDEFFGFNDIGLYLMIDEDTVLPSIPFLFKHSLNNYSTIHFYNLPYYTKLSRFDIIRDNPDQNISFDLPVTKAPLNATLKLINDRFIPLSLSYNISRYKDYLYYESSDSLFFEMQNSYLTGQKINFSSAYHYNALTLRHSSSYLLRNRDLPFEPEWEHSLSVNWNQNDTSVTKKITYLDGRKDQEENRIDESFFLNLNAEQKISKDLTLIIAAENILNTGHRDYLLPGSNSNPKKEIPSAGVTIRAGLTWNF